ncbi:MAG: hypothetical protein IKX14_05850 [Neisseriaceae bacterium]|nr:hypothetical protein [Neisseriaceae bacterium]
MMKKIVFSLLLCSSLLGLSACEDKAEKRAKLQAQIEQAKKELNNCVIQNRKKDFDDFKVACEKQNTKLKDLRQQLDELNGIK